jgi:parvulin-like peptidyl-prolyl isomerase
MKNYKMIITILVIVAAGVGTHFWNKSHKKTTNKTIEVKEVNKTALRAKMKKEGVILTINNKKYTKEDFPKEYGELKNKGKERFLSKYLYLKVVLELLRDERELYKKEINERLVKDRERLARQGVILDGLEKFISELDIAFNEIAYQEILKKHKNIDKEVKDFYKRNEKEYNYPDAIDVAHISFNSEDEAKKVLDELKEQNLSIEVFAKYVEKYSKDLKTIMEGGYIGRVGEKQIGKVSFDMIWKSKDRGIADKLLVEGNYYHIIYILKKYPAYKSTLKEERNKIINFLLAKEIKKWKLEKFKIGDKKCRVEVYDIDVD